jgi:uncharacterized protein (DUF488 family)
LDELFTIGYEKRPIEELVELLAEARVDVILDVRDKPVSRKPGFSKRGLAAALAKANIGYVHAGFAGNPKSLRDSAASPAEALRSYERHLDRNPAVLAELSDLIAKLHGEGKRACLLCLERDPAECHRGILARRWKGNTARKVVSLGIEE